MLVSRGVENDICVMNLGLNEDCDHFKKDSNQKRRLGRLIVNWRSLCSMLVTELRGICCQHPTLAAGTALSLTPTIVHDDLPCPLDDTQRDDRFTRLRNLSSFHSR